MTSSETREGAGRARLGEVFQQVLEAAVAVLGLAKIGLGVEVDVAEHAFELGLVGLLDLLERDVDQLADVGRLAPLVQGVEVGKETIGDLAGLFVLELDVGQDEALALQLAADALLVVAVLLLVFGVVVVPRDRRCTSGTASPGCSPCTAPDRSTPRKVSQAAQAVLLTSCWGAARSWGGLVGKLHQNVGGQALAQGGDLGQQCLLLLGQGGGANDALLRGR